jgi:hypothetical protein
MSSDFPMVNLPYQFTSLLRANMQVGGNSLDNIRVFINSQKSMVVLINLIFQDLGKKLEIGSIIKAVGWTGFRDRITNAYVDYALTGEFPSKPNIHNISSIIDLEEDVKPYSVAGFSRGYLLGFYLRMAQIQMEQTGKDFSIVTDELIKILKLSKIKIVKVDWLLLSLYHLEGYLGRDLLLSAIDKGVRFEKLYEKLTEDQMSVMMRNLLSYGYSIGDHEIFYSKTV